jgi:hypothetical protein
MAGFHATFTLLLLFTISKISFCGDERTSLLTDTRLGPVALSDRVVAPAADVAEHQGKAAYQEPSQAYTVLVPFYSGEQVQTCCQLPAESESASMLLLTGSDIQQLLPVLV